ncbi:Aspartyl-tRNA(Asn) amidotransferase subunit A [Minicystis rosea]|nr:Aspartyl-tRNA(Asn) amidotransferase subunit A [Minicystis rosea]
MRSLLRQSIPDLARLVSQGEVSAEEVTRAALDRIERHDGLYGAFLTVQAERALDDARTVDARRLRGERLGALAGVPIGIKDALCTRDTPTTAGSKILTRAARKGQPERDPRRGWCPPYDATVVSRLRAAGAILVGKCNMDELAMGSSNENSAFFPARNPWDTTRAPGGSSGGSAVAVSAGMAAGALGSDTGGSIRQPAAFTGTVGIKPTYGRVSRHGLVAFASSLDQVGPFASDVRGAARLLEVISGHDPLDATSLDTPVGDYEEACGRDVAGLRIGVPEEYFGQGLAPGVEATVREAIRRLERLGCVVRPVNLAHTRYAVATYYIIATAEASSNLARLDGVRFGLRVEPQGGDLSALYDATRGAGFGREVKRRILLGTYVLSAGYYDAYYLRAQRVRTLIRRDFDDAFSTVDVIAAPVSPVVAFKLGERIDDPLAMYLADVYTLPASLAGMPAMSLPCGLTAPPEGGSPLPVGLQLIAPALQEERLCALGHAFEQVAPRTAFPPEPTS